MLFGSFSGGIKKPINGIFCYDKALEQKPEDVRMLNNLTEIYSRLKRNDEVENLAEKTLELAATRYFLLVTI